MKGLGITLLALIALSPRPAAGADWGVAAVANPDASDLVCPEGSTGSSTAKPKAAPPPEPLPTAEDLSGLAQPALPAPEKPTRAVDSALLAGFAPAGGSARGERGADAPLRIALWGDSHTAAGVFGEELTRALEARGLTVETSFLPPTMGRAGVRLPIRKHCISKSWTFEPAYLSSEPGFPSGPALANRRSTAPGSYLWLDLRTPERVPRARQVRMLYLPAEAATVAFSIDDGREQIVRLAKAAPEEGLYSADVEIVADAPLSTLKLRVIEGTLVLQGFRLTYPNPRPVTLDVFAFPSATIRGWAQIDIPFLKQSLRGTPYDAVILEYGTNEGNVSPFDRTQYAAGLAKALAAFRDVFPTASCLLVGPTDRGVPARRGKKVDWLRYARIHREISGLQAEIGARFHCAAWDWQAFMGGPGGIYRWALASPPLAARDLTHLTPAGYRQSAAAVARALGWGAAP